MVSIFYLQCLMLVSAVLGITQKTQIGKDKDVHQREPQLYTFANFKNFISHGFENFGDDSSTTILIVVLIVLLVIIALIICCCCCACCAAAGMVAEAKKQQEEQ